MALAAREKEAVRFLVVDLDHPSREQKALVSRFYRGYIPTLAFLDASGKTIYNRSGETANRRVDHRTRAWRLPVQVLRYRRARTPAVISRLVGGF